MDFLREKLSLVTAEPGPTDTFFADLLQPRPDFETLTAFNGWSVRLRQEMTAIKARKNCPVAWVGLFVDQAGLSIVLHFAHTLQLCDAKMAAKTLTHFLVKGMQLALQSTLRPLDELDRKRIEGWCTPMSVCPPDLCKKRVREEAGEVDNLSVFQQWECRTLAKRPRKMAQFLAEDSSDDDVDCPVAPSVLALQDAHGSGGESLSGIWHHRVKTESTVVVAEVGQRPAQLTWVRCHREARRLALLVQSVQEEYKKGGMVEVVRTAAALATEGSIPGHVGARGRKSEFLKFCAKALESINAGAEKDITKLSKSAQDTIRSILGAGEPYDGCFNQECLDVKTTWIIRPGGRWQRCSRCGLTPGFGRIYTKSTDWHREEQRRLRDRVALPSGFSRYS